MSRHFVEHIAFGYSDVAGEVPPSDLQRGELWINGHDFKVWVGQDSPNNFELTAGGCVWLCAVWFGGVVVGGVVGWGC